MMRISDNFDPIRKVFLKHCEKSPLDATSHIKLQHEYAAVLQREACYKVHLADQNPRQLKIGQVYIDRHAEFTSIVNNLH